MNVKEKIKETLSASMDLTEIPADNEEKLKKGIAKILNSAEQYIYLSTTLYPDFYNDDKIRKAMVKASKRVSDEINILIDKGVNIKNIEDKMSWIFKLNNVKIRQANYKVAHWIIIDDKKLRLEKNAVSGHNSPNLIVNDCHTILADVFVEDFLRCWAESDKLK